MQSAINTPLQGVNRRANRDRLLELLAIERLDPALTFGRLGEDQVETIVSVALADVTDDPQDTAFVLLECLTLLVRDGQFARMRILANRLRGVAHHAAGRRYYLELGFLSVALMLEGNSVRALNELRRGLDSKTRSAPSSDKTSHPLDLAVSGSIKMAFIDGDISFARRARDLATRMGDGLSVALLDCALIWHEARTAADPLTNLQLADPVFEEPALAAYVQARGIEVLFPSQISAVRNGLTTDQELTISLPTSSGKTLLAEFKVAATLQRYPESTVIYVAPYRLLSRQVARAFSKYLSRLGHSVQDLGSGYEVDSPSRFGNVLVCTPERLDALIRQAANDAQTSNVLARCRLLVFDEMHLIGRAGRGPRFEMLLTRLKMRFPDVRFLALSAASQGVDEVADWLTSGRLVRGGRRPTGTIEVAWRTSGKLVQRVDRQKATEVAELRRSKRPLDDAALLIARLTSEYRPVLAVCTQRAYAESLATKLVDDDPIGNRVWVESLDRGQSDLLEAAVELVGSVLGPRHPLTICLRHGVGFHHAGVPALVLGLIEQLAREKVLRAVAATTTVAEGADLPFRAVVIPHLNFQSASRKLDRDLYLNIIGRAGRVNVSMEGVVFILDSDAQSLRSHISGALWTTAEVGRVRGQLSGISASPSNPDETSWYGEFESQVMGWLGDGDSYYANQASLLAEGTFTYQTGSPSEKRYIESLTEGVLESLEQRGFARAASPYRLTERGERARLTGLNADSVVRLEEALIASHDGWLPSLLGATELSAEQREQVSRMIFESTETMASSLWLRREKKTDGAKAAYLEEYASQHADEHLESDTFWSEVSAMGMWIGGYSYLEIAESMPTFGGSGLFGSAVESSRVSDVAEYVSKIGYPGSWTWSAVQLLSRQIHDLVLPAWISSAVEFGAPTETAVMLMRLGAMSRPGAITLSGQLGSDWQDAADRLVQGDFDTEWLTSVDEGRLETLRMALSEPRD
ncbi:DEAD/DEAH box helicase [Phycicoccus sp. MAQZ13P-2]|uniref:DEAD/DEAH box helicase n=1 Tax=Phycicoccus mangrovi TaxID=2840470 RepID=UPI001BFFF7E0|nr:DEAD/DEAH box helicase [Phycicoccus mangrovi]MBT9273559.1 DEAD/DEAH box helicase [Phycicoccus mangrovi]